MNRTGEIRWITAFILLSLFGLSGCVSRNSIESPEVTVDLSTGYVNSLQGEAPSTLVLVPWWEQVGDPVLEALVQQMLQGNFTLKEATERIEQSAQHVAIQRGGRTPSLTLDGGAARSFTPSPAGNDDRVYGSQYDLSLSVGWQADVFGRVRSGVELAESNLLATEADRSAIEQILIAELARARLSATINRELLEFARLNLANRKDLVEITERRYRLGTYTSSLLDVHLAREATASVEAEVAEFNRLLTDSLYRIDVLLGNRPGLSETPTDPWSLPEKWPPIPSTIPASLLDNRPDLKAAEFRLYAAQANVAVAVADLYPDIGISGQLSLSSADLSDLLDLDQLVGLLVSSMVQPLFRGGSLKANVKLQESVMRELAYSFESQLLEAIREVESALQAEKRLDQRLQSQRASVEALKQAEALAEKRYHDGLQSLQSFLEVQQRRYLAEQNALLTHQLRWNNQIDLYLALGGYIPLSR